MSEMSDSSSKTVSSWAELSTYLQSKHSATPDVPEDSGDETDGLQVSFEGLALPVHVRPIEVFGARWVEFVAVLATQRSGMFRKVPPEQALRRNFKLPIGALAMADGEVSMRQLLPLEGLQPAAADEVLATMRSAIADGQRG
jgi:hypothetical protein